ncbi:MAG: histidine kinase [Devosia sp.]|nr:histidine kinase [Devosia sp.]
MDELMPLSQRLIVRSSILLLLLGLVALLLIVGTTIWLAERSQSYFSEVIEARDARSATVELRNAVITAESSQRGYVLTANEIYLAPYDTAKAMAFRQVDAITEILDPYPEAAAPLQRLVQTMHDKFAEMDETISLKRTRQDAEALALIRTNRGKALMDEANVFFSGVIRAADERLTAGVSEQRSNATWLRWVSVTGGVIIVAVVGGVALAAVRYTRELARTRDEVQTLNAGLEERVAERTANLVQANDEIQRFAYIVTHDLRAPLVNIMGFTSELETGVGSLKAMIERFRGDADPADPVVRDAELAATIDLPEAIGFIRSSTKRMDHLINAILRLSREGGRALRPETFDLSELVSASAAGLQHQVSEADGAISVAVAVPPLETDRLSVEQIVGNLLDNAVKYRAKGRPLQVDVKAKLLSRDRVEITVADNGRGIAAQDLERVFELFRRAGAQDQPGEGIGLAHVRTLVRNLGGDITLASTPGVGTTFSLTFPRRLQPSRIQAK